MMGRKSHLEGMEPVGFYDLRGAEATSLPIVMTELLWVLGESGYAVVYGRMGTDELAAMTMTYPLQGLSINLLSGLAGAASVLIGNRLGANNFDLRSISIED